MQAKTIEISGGGQSWQPKTRCNRAVPISAALRGHLDRYTPPKSDTPSGGGWFFPSPAAPPVARLGG